MRAEDGRADVRYVFPCFIFIFILFFLCIGLLMHIGVQTLGGGLGNG